MEDMANMEIKSEEVDAILGKTPSKLIIYSTSVIFGFVLIILAGTMLFPYPEQIDCKFTIMSSAPPIQIFSQARGQIILYTKDKAQVKKGQILALIANPTDLSDMLFVEKILDSLSIENSAGIKLDELKLGELTQTFLELKKSLDDYHTYIRLDHIPQKIQKLNLQIKETHDRKDMLISQINIFAADFELIKKNYERDSLLFKKGVISTTELEASKSAVLQKKNSSIEANIAYKNDLIQIEQLEVSLIDLEAELQQQKQYLTDNILRNIELLKSHIKDWKKKYALISPYDGVTSFFALWSDNQWVEIGEPVMTILPENEEKIIGRMEIPILRSGKVKVNQPIMLKFSNYPYMEYGIVYGKIKSISLVPYKENYIAEIEIPNLTTNYHYTIPFNQQMEGIASVIVKDVSLFERFLQPVIYSINGRKTPKD
jgi:HlyD family secretion protein